ncbi:hypothetical protein [Rathayibacter toxicus]|uniref:Uncharacterized protein n=1 Tax=Rathayibacter toxicus TaxID=145458 RepID=A0A0C5BR77_9MICO|nr:hypothetical protein [Rathayibacter toxicus]AJM77147.1 hypothetical protein TI83_02595 [Rathayibacter toxicus]ALS57011.1 hypothetical protein APU90_03875 [Rathayibacter toxicus]KKM46161.1 hypothetical protein VT73_03620 [Rathayibacter toxicus]PPG23113.1 hypothetical protein C5D15_02380 [Rathayibacter toxicus]PPG47696.1 hypothetical protein C5D16_02375 [Rathayibacter toxicus]
MIAGLVALLIRGDGLVDALSQPVSYSTLFVLFLGILLSTALHEVGHGLVLAAYGAAPNRVGVMLFSLMPAFFCLSRPRTGNSCSRTEETRESHVKPVDPAPSTVRAPTRA